MTRTRTLIIIGVFMLCLAVLAALEFRTEDSVLSEGQMVTGSVAKDVASPSEAQALPEQAQLPTSAVGASDVKGGVLVPLDNGTLRGTSGTTLDMTNTAPPESTAVATPPASSSTAARSATPADPAGTPTPALPATPTKATPPATTAHQPQHAPALKDEKTPAHSAEQKNAPTKKESAPTTPAKAAAPAKKTPERAEKPDTPVVLTAKAPAKLVGNQKAITQTRLEMGKGISFKMTGAGPLTVKTLLLADPDRYVVDLQGEWGIQLPRVPKNQILKEIRVGQRDGATRLVFELSRKPDSVQVNKVNAKTLDVRIR